MSPPHIKYYPKEVQEKCEREWALYKQEHRREVAELDRMSRMRPKPATYPPILLRAIIRCPPKAVPFILVMGAGACGVGLALGTVKLLDWNMRRHEGKAPERMTRE